MNYIESWVNYYLPITPEPSFSARRCKLYVSDEANRAVTRARNSGVIACKPSAVVQDLESDDVIDMPQLPRSPRASPRGSPRASPRASPRISPRATPARSSLPSLARTADVHGSGLDEPLEMPVRKRGIRLDDPTGMLSRLRNTPQTQQVLQQMLRDEDDDDDNDNDEQEEDDTADRIGALDNATARVMVRSNIYTTCHFILDYNFFIS